MSITSKTLGHQNFGKRIFWDQRFGPRDSVEWKMDVLNSSHSVSIGFLKVKKSEPVSLATMRVTAIDWSFGSISSALGVEPKIYYRDLTAGDKLVLKKDKKKLFFSISSLVLFDCEMSEFDPDSPSFGLAFDSLSHHLHQRSWLH